MPWDCGVGSVFALEGAAREVSGIELTAFQKLAPFSRAAFMGLTDSSWVNLPDMVRSGENIRCKIQRVIALLDLGLTHHAESDWAHRFPCYGLGSSGGSHC